MGQICPKWDKSGTVADQISVHFGSVSQNVLKSDLRQSRFVTFGANLTNSGSNLTSVVTVPYFRVSKSQVSDRDVIFGIQIGSDWPKMG